MAGYTAYTDAVVTTLEKRQRKLADNILNNNVLLAWLKKSGNIKMQSGGRVIVEEIMYPGGTNYKRYSGYEALDLTPVQFLTAAEYPWAQAASTVTASGLELRSNKGKEALINLFDSRIMATEKDMANNIALDIYSDGSADSGKQIGGLDALIAEDPATGIVGGLNRADDTWWANNTSGDLTVSATTIQGFMQTEWLKCVRGTDHPKLIVADVNFFGFFWNSLLEIQRLTSPDTGISGFRSIEFSGPSGRAPVFFDSACTTNRMYMLNPDYLFFKPHRDAYFTSQPEVRSMNQDAVMVPILFQGNMTMSNAGLQSVLWT